jgi:hypothetical protein
MIARLLAHFGHQHFAERPLCAKTGPSSNVAFDPGCVKTCASRECAELFSLLSPFECDCQCCTFPIQRNRDKISTCKFDVGVFTQPGPNSDMMPFVFAPQIAFNRSDFFPEKYVTKGCVFFIRRRRFHRRAQRDQTIWRTPAGPRRWAGTGCGWSG